MLQWFYDTVLAKSVLGSQEIYKYLFSSFPISQLSAHPPFGGKQYTHFRKEKKEKKGGGGGENNVSLSYPKDKQGVVCIYS